MKPIFSFWAMYLLQQQTKSNQIFVYTFSIRCSDIPCILRYTIFHTSKGRIINKKKKDTKNVSLTQRMHTRYAKSKTRRASVFIAYCLKQHLSLVARPYKSNTSAWLFLIGALRAGGQKSSHLFWAAQLLGPFPSSAGVARGRKGGKRGESYYLDCGTRRAGNSCPASREWPTSLARAAVRPGNRVSDRATRICIGRRRPACCPPGNPPSRPLQQQQKKTDVHHLVSSEYSLIIYRIGWCVCKCGFLRVMKLWAKGFFKVTNISFSLKRKLNKEKEWISLKLLQKWIRINELCFLLKLIL